MKKHLSSMWPGRTARMALACVAAVPAILFCGCGHEAAPPTIVSVQAAHPERCPLSEQILADAVLSPVAQAAIVPKITAPVKKFYVQRGTYVHTGELLAVLENADLTAAALDSKGAYEAAQGAYATATRAQVPEEVQAAEAAEEQAKANLQLNEDIVKSRTALLAEGAIPQRELDSAKAALVQAQGIYATAVQHLDAMHKVNRKAALEEAQGQLTSAQGRYENAEAQVTYTEIRSPIDGVVAERPLFAGETASAGTPLLTVMDTSTLIAKAHIAESEAQELKVGGPAAVTVPGMTRPFPATVAMISPALDPGSTTVEVWLKVDNRSRELKAGTPVMAEIRGTTVANALTVPASAVQTADDGSKFLMVVGSDGTAKKQPVTLGIITAQQAQVIGGITPSDEVITVGAYALDAGTKVKVSPAATDTALNSDAGTSGGGN